MRRFTSASLALALAFLLTAMQARAVPVDFSESIGGDLAHPTGPNGIEFANFQLFEADIGTNVFSGHYWETFVPLGRDRDSFRLVVPDNMELTAVFLEVAGIHSTNLTSWRGGAHLRRDGALFDVDGFCVVANGGSECNAIDTDPLSLWRFAAPSERLAAFGNGIFDITLGHDSSTGRVGSSLDFDWRLSFIVDELANPVPEPATLGLLGFALAALGLVGRRRRKSAARRKSARRTTG